MNKKGILIVLCLLAALLPVSVNAKPYASYPYVYENFESLTANVASSSAAYQMVGSGYGNSRGCMKVTVSGDLEAVSFPVHMEKGKLYNIRCRVKAGSEFRLDGYVTFILYFKQKDGDTKGYLAATSSKIIIQTEKWTEIRANLTFNERARIPGVGETDVVNDGTIEMRIGTGYLADVSGGSKFTYYIDDLSVQPSLSESTVTDSKEEIPVEKVYDTPEIRNVKADGYLAEEQTIDVSCVYLGKNTRTGLVQIFKQADDGGWASIMACELTDHNMYKFRSEDAGQNVKVFILPMDTTGQVGGYRELALGKVKYKLKIAPSFLTDLNGSLVTAKIDIQNCSGAVDLVGVLMLYNADNACVASAYKHSKTDFDGSDTLQLSANNPGTAVTAKLFMWRGLSDIDTSMVSLQPCLVITK